MIKTNNEKVLEINPKLTVRQFTSFGILLIFSIVQLFSQPAVWAESDPIATQRDLLTPTKSVTQTSTSTETESSIRSINTQAAEATVTFTNSGIGVAVGSENSLSYEAPIKKITNANDKTQTEAQHRAELENFIDLYIKAASKYQAKFKDAFQPIAREYLILTAEQMQTLIQKLEKDGDLNAQQADSARILDFSARFMIANAKAITSGTEALTPGSFLPKNLSDKEKMTYLNGLNAFAARFDALIPLVQIENIPANLGLDEIEKLVTSLKRDFGENPQTVFQKTLEASKKGIAGTLRLIEEANYQILNLQDHTSERQKLEAYILSIQQAFEKADPKLRNAFIPLSREELVSTRADIEKYLSQLPETERSQFSTLLQDVDAALFIIQAAKDMQKPGFELLKSPDNFSKLPVLIQTFIMALVKIQPPSGPMQDMDDLREEVEILRSVYGNNPSAYYQRLLEGKERVAPQILSWIESVNNQILNLQNQQNFEVNTRTILEKDWLQIADASRGFMEEVKNAWRGLDGVRIQNPKNELEKYLNLFIDAAVQGKLPTAPKPEGFDQFAREIGIISVVVIDPDLNVSKLTTDELNNKMIEIKKLVPDPTAYYFKASLKIRKMLRDITLAITTINQNSTPTIRVNSVKRSKNRRIFLPA